MLLVPSWKTVMARMDGRDWRDLLLLSLLGNLIYYVGLAVAVQSAGVALASTTGIASNRARITATCDR